MFCHFQLKWVKKFQMITNSRSNYFIYCFYVKSITDFSTASNTCGQKYYHPSFFSQLPSKEPGFFFFFLWWGGSLLFVLTDNFPGSLTVLPLLNFIFLGTAFLEACQNKTLIVPIILLNLQQMSKTVWQAVSCIFVALTRWFPKGLCEKHASIQKKDASCFWSLLDFFPSFYGWCSSVLDRFCFVLR